jgi:hypothetical protein
VQCHIDTLRQTCLVTDDRLLEVSGMFTLKVDCAKIISHCSFKICYRIVENFLNASYIFCTTSVWKLSVAVPIPINISL